MTSAVVDRVDRQRNACLGIPRALLTRALPMLATMRSFISK